MAATGLSATTQVSAQTILPTQVITATRLPADGETIGRDVSILTREQLQAYTGQTVLEALTALAGIQVVSQGGPGKVSSVFIRGNSARHTLVLIDGIRYGTVTTGSAALDQIPVSQIERIEVLRGNAASLYGADAIGGVIQIFTYRNADRAGWHPQVEVGAGNLGQQHLRVAATYADSRSDINVAVSQDQLDGISAVINPANSNYFEDRDGYENRSARIGGRYRINDQLQGGLQLLGIDGAGQFDSTAYDASFNPVAQSFDYRYRARNSSASLWLDWQASLDWQSRLQYGRTTDDNQNIVPVSAIDLSEQNQRFTTVQQQVQWQNRFQRPSGQWLLGLEHLNQSVDSTTAYDETDRTIDSLVVSYQGAAGAYSWLGSARYDRNSQYGSETTWQAGGTYQFAPLWLTGLSLATGFAAPSFNDLYFPGYGRADLLPERSRGAEVFVQYRQPLWRSRLTWAKNRVDNLIQYDAATFGPSNIGTADISNLNWLLEGRYQDMNWGLSADWLKAVDAAEGANKDNRLARRAPRSAVAHAGWRHGNWTNRVELQGQAARFDDAGNRNRLPGFALLNLSSQWQLTPEWQLGLRLNNALDQSYQLARDYGTLGRNGLITLRWQPVQ